jgi:hypothetical protein
MAVTFLVLKVGCFEIPLYVFERTGIKLLLRGNPSTLIDGFHSSPCDVVPSRYRTGTFVRRRTWSKIG